jgi:hypothetical protein
MFSLLFFSFIAFWVALLPVYLWGYGISYLLDTPWNRRRFLMGMVIGSLSVGWVWLFSHIEIDNYKNIFLSSIIFIGVIFIFIFFLIQQGSSIARWLLKKFTIINSIIIVAVFIGSIMIANSLEWWYILMIAIIPFLLSALIEESSKHLMSIGLMSQDFRFSRSDIIIFTFFVVLGFVFVENLLYLVQVIQGKLSLTTWIFRSFFTLIAHLISAIICAYAWWRALSYEPFSYQYIIIFTFWFTLAVMAHLGYNMALNAGHIIGIYIYMLIGYILITKGIMIRK